MPADDRSHMIGKVCLITGATSGIGQAAAMELARRGATVVLVGRNPAKTAGITEQIRKETGNTAVDFLVADLSSQQSIRELASQFQERYNRLHVLLNNAGAAYFDRRESVDGIELTFALNHLGYFLLTNLLLDTLKASAPSRVICVSSDAHRMVRRFDFDDFEGKTRYRWLRAYGLSKLANLLFTYELARRLEGTGVTANALHPGLVSTQFGTDNGWRGRWVRWISDRFAIPVSEGAKTSIYLACSPEVATTTGQYFVKERIVPSTPGSRDQAAAERLWELSEALTRSKSLTTSSNHARGHAMNADELRALQAPLKERYRNDPSAAVLTLRAHGDVNSPQLACKVETGRGVIAAGLHPATGGDGMLACSGDMLLEALVACAGVTLRAVATALDIPLRGGTITAEGDLDFRGTLGVSKEAPVGLRALRLHFDLDTDATDEQLQTLMKLTERYCVVYQTLRNPPEMSVRHQVRQAQPSV